MPNWCNAVIQIKGKPKDIENFCKLFIFEEQEGKKKSPFFARSFIWTSWKDFKKENLGKNEAEFLVDFAWSCWSCVFEGYPNKKKRLLTLQDAVKKFKVNVTIDTEEGGMGFEEHIKTDEKGQINYSCEDMKIYVCKNCKNKEQIASSCDLSDYGCCECGKSDWRRK